VLIEDVMMEFRLVYKFLKRDDALWDIRKRKVKISEILDLNDPFELIPFDLSDPEFRKGMLNSRDRLNTNRGLLSCSSEWTCPVLWAHYSEKHKGICLGFDVPEERATDIEYVQTRLPPPKKLDERVAHQMLFTKYSGWAYEKEVRVYTERVQDENGLYFAEFGENLRLREVRAGHRCCIERGEISAALESYPESVALIRTRLSHTSFEVEEDPEGFAN